MLILYEKEGKEDEFYEENMYVSLVSKKELKVNMRIGFPFQRKEKVPKLPELPRKKKKGEPEYFEKIWFPNST